MAIILDGIKYGDTRDDPRTASTTQLAPIQHNEASTSNITQPTELGETLKELNDDTIEPETRMSGIDMRARLHPMEIVGLLGIDTLVAFRVLPESCLQFTRQKKRLSVSIKGEGRKEIVDITGGKREHDAKMGGGGFVDKLRSFAGMGPQS